MTHLNGGPYPPVPLEELVSDWKKAISEGDRARPCACGVMVIASPADPGPGVRAHQATPEHRAWREGQEFDE